MFAQSTLRPRRRRRAQIACNPCRTRKTGCDGHRPVCSSCSTKGLGDQCRYQEKNSKLPAPNLANVSNRLQILEQNLRDLPRNLPDNTIATVHEGSSSFVTPEQTSIDNSQDGENLGHGPSSNISFIRQAIKAVPELGMQCEFSKTRTVPDLLGFDVDQPNHLPPVDSISTLEDEYDESVFVQSFRENIQSLVPLLHWPTFYSRYSHLSKLEIASVGQTSQSGEVTVFWAIANMVLALGCQRSMDLSSTVNRHQIAGGFYRKSLGLVSIETLDFSSLDVVQLLLLRGLYLHHTTHADRCWNTIGAALRVAQSLGIPWAETASAETQFTREMKRRVWYCCVALDRVSATIFGRPVIYDRQINVPVPESIDDEYLSETETHHGRQPGHSPSRLEYFRQSIILSDILLEILRKFYSHGQQNSSGGDDNAVFDHRLGEVTQLHSRLDDFVTGLPKHLQVNELQTLRGPQVRCFSLQAKNLHSRTLYLKLLLLRPSILHEAKLARSTGGRKRPSLSAVLLKEIKRVCITTAHDILEEMHHQIDTQQQTSAWHTLFFTFGAASTIFVASACPNLDVDLNADLTDSLLQKALRIFDYYKPHVKSAAKGIEALRMYRRQFSRPIEQDLADGESYRVSGPSNCTSYTDVNWWAEMDDSTAIFTSDLLEDGWLNYQGLDWA